MNTNARESDEPNKSSLSNYDWLTCCQELVQCCRSILVRRRSFDREVHEYLSSIDGGICAILEALEGALTFGLNLDNEPFHDFGAEPRTRYNAIEQLGLFLSECEHLLNSAITGCGSPPRTAMSARVTTFRCMIQDDDGR